MYQAGSDGRLRTGAREDVVRRPLLVSLRSIDRAWPGYLGFSHPVEKASQATNTN